MSRLFINGLSPDTTKDDIVALFAGFDTVEDVVIHLNPWDNTCKGSCHASCSSVAKAQAALRQFNGMAYKGKSLKIEVAKPKAGDLARQRQQQAQAKPAAAPAPPPPPPQPTPKPARPADSSSDDDGNFVVKAKPSAAVPPPPASSQPVAAAPLKRAAADSSSDDDRAAPPPQKFQRTEDPAQGPAANGGGFGARPFRQDQPFRQQQPRQWGGRGGDRDMAGGYGGDGEYSRRPRQPSQWDSRPPAAPTPAPAPVPAPAPAPAPTRAPPKAPKAESSDSDSSDDAPVAPRGRPSAKPTQAAEAPAPFAARSAAIEPFSSGSQKKTAAAATPVAVKAPVAAAAPAKNVLTGNAAKAWERFLVSLEEKGFPFESIQGCSEAEFEKVLDEFDMGALERAAVKTGFRVMKNL